MSPSAPAAASPPYRCHVFLIPGFFGFADLGDVRYFAHVERSLRKALRARGVEPRLHMARVPPTGSLTRRAAALAEEIAAADPAIEDVHLIGHSTGGLDARLLCAPGVELPTDVPVGPIAARVRSVVAVATPHRGTPMAAWFTNRLGQPLLRLVSAATLRVIQLGGVPRRPLVRLLRALRPTGGLAGLDGGLLDSIYSDILRDFSPESREQLSRFFAEVTADTALMAQLGTQAMDLFNAKATAREGVRYGSVVTRARPPSLRGMVKAGLRPGMQGTYALYQLLYRISGAWTPADVHDDLMQRRTLEAAYGDLPDPTANDAIVPTRSQVYGKVVRAVWADHLDVIGHFSGARLDPPHHDWLHTRSHFDSAAFEAVWSDVAAFALGVRPRRGSRSPWPVSSPDDAPDG